MGMRAIGYHGTSVQAAQRILSSGFQVSRNEYDWLGDGAYFFQDAPARALEWARHRFEDDAAVVAAEIDLEGCVDLLDIPWERLILRAFELYIDLLAQTGRGVPRQTAGAHMLDRQVLNYFAEGMEREGARALRPGRVSGGGADLPGIGAAERGTRADRGEEPCCDRPDVAPRRGDRPCWILKRRAPGWSTTSPR
jgi:hypothetical protein